MTDWTIKPKYQENPTWYVKRNVELLRDRQSGMSIGQMCGKYNINQTRLYNLIKKLEDQNARTNKKR